MTLISRTNVRRCSRRLFKAPQHDKGHFVMTGKRWVDNKKKPRKLNFRGKNGLLDHFSEDGAARTDLAHQAVEADFAEQLSSRGVISKAANGASVLQ